jgi:zinc protease
MSFPEPRMTDVDGVTVWFTDVPGPTMGGITFRTGAVDERLTNAGIDHMVEHLALHPFPPRRYELNGQVTELTTRFLANGTQRDVEDVITGVCRNLSALQLDRLENERRILDNESRRRGGSFAGLASTRFGTRGAGIVDYPEYTRGITPELITAWVAERFTKGQAAIWMTRPPSDTFEIPLAEGPRLAIPPVEPLAGLVTPSHAHVAPFTDHLGCSILAKRSIEMFIATQLFLTRGFEKLRTELGLAYTVSADASRIGATESLYVLVCDAPTRARGESLAAFVEVVEDLAGGDLSDEEVRATFERSMPWNSSDPARTVKEVSRKADAWLLGHTPTTWSELAEQGASLTASAVQSAFAEGLEQAIFAAPFGTEPPERFARYPYEPPTRTRFGKTYVRWDADRRDMVTVSHTGVTRLVGGTVQSAEFDDVDALALGQDGTISLVRRDGMSLVLDPNQLMRGRELAEELQERLADRVLDLRGDVLAWFEMQLVLETHDRELIRSVWRELAMLAEQRDLHERVLAVAVADLDGHRGVLAVTDRRIVHIAAERAEETWAIDRSEVVAVDTSWGIRGGRLVLSVVMGNVTLDRIRPRGHEAELAALLTPIGGNGGS